MPDGDDVMTSYYPRTYSPTWNPSSAVPLAPWEI